MHVILEVCKTDGIHPETTPAFHLAAEAHFDACHSGGHKTDGIHPETTPAFHLVAEAHCVACHSGGHKTDGIHTYEHLIHRYTKLTLFLYRPLKKQFIFYFES